MSSVFHCIPGIELPVSEVVSSMAKMWESEPAKGHKPPSEFRASQMNLIVHLGYNTTTEEAKQLFRTANAFAHGYPSRIIILCPTPAEDADTLLMGKLYSECYIGQSMRDMRCCEILTLGYDENAPQYLENQVSVWLESDLPAYYWCHRLPSERLNTVYKDFLRFCKCKIYDSSVEGRQFRSQLKEPEIYRNLSYARLLPLRQSIGQVLSGFEPSCLVEGLESVTLSCSNAHYGEGGALSHWIYSCLEECAKIAGMKISFDLVDVSGGGTRDFDLKFHFSDNKQLQFLANIASGTASLHGEMGRGVFSYSLKSGLLSPEKALAEAIFFNN
ncbi:MAG: glucose-6-phosphate dehydrogenase assembly protein OpcA [Verrucomicrobiae bacterium]|nr:glucose-6-phosphate dehydrogenase assembly protein OpcA [Verrucomicrobiae bacterium]